MAFDGIRQHLGAIIDGFDAAQSHWRLRGFRASFALVNTLIAGAGWRGQPVDRAARSDRESVNPQRTEAKRAL